MQVIKCVKEMSVFILNRSISARKKGKVYRNVIRSTMFYGLETVGGAGDIEVFVGRDEDGQD